MTTRRAGSLGERPATSPEPPAPRAARLFHFEDAAPDSPFVDRVWRTRSGRAQAFLSVATAHWELVFSREDGGQSVTVRGPQTRATPAAAPAHGEFFGIRFALGTFLPSLPLHRLVDGGLSLPVTGTSFWLNGRGWDLPDFDDADIFVRRLVREEGLARDPVVEAALSGRDDPSPRTSQRRFRRATGLTHRTLRQIERAERAVELLDRGATILDAVERAGYADQAHLTRSLRRFAGQTPAQIARGRPAGRTVADEPGCPSG